MCRSLGVGLYKITVNNVSLSDSESIKDYYLSYTVIIIRGGVAYNIDNSVMVKQLHLLYTVGFRSVGE